MVVSPLKEPFSARNSSIARLIAERAWCCTVEEYRPPAATVLTLLGLLLPLCGSIPTTHLKRNVEFFLASLKGSNLINSFEVMKYSPLKKLQSDLSSGSVLEVEHKVRSKQHNYPIVKGYSASQHRSIQA